MVSLFDGEALNGLLGVPNKRLQPTRLRRGGAAVRSRTECDQ
jgi:hypothetical protein